MIHVNRFIFSIKRVHIENKTILWPESDLMSDSDILNCKYYMSNIFILEYVTGSRAPAVSLLLLSVEPFACCGRKRLVLLAR